MDKAINRQRAAMLLLELPEHVPPNHAATGTAEFPQFTSNWLSRSWNSPENHPATATGQKTTQPLLLVPIQASAKRVFWQVVTKGTLSRYILCITRSVLRQTAAIVQAYCLSEVTGYPLDMCTRDFYGYKFEQHMNRWPHRGSVGVPMSVPSCGDPSSRPPGPGTEGTPTFQPVSP
uniref:Uncharacterized protein n=1 Tax=Branchiostoma floridae TaxID=7739 RepID=C3XZ51_BRAFL|eukprot:XP_002610605.1 hypothetical protein BRAFLDRAFT_65795 [Branchiostoma floridae]